MGFESLDEIFPYVVFAYGILVSFALRTPALAELGRRELPPTLWERMSAHRVLADICLWVGGLWILQNLWLA